MQEGASVPPSRTPPFARAVGGAPPPPKIPHPTTAISRGPRVRRIASRLESAFGVSGRSTHIQGGAHAYGDSGVFCGWEGAGVSAAAAASAVDRLREALGEVADIERAGEVLRWDQETYMPPGGIDD